MIWFAIIFGIVLILAIVVAMAAASDYGDWLDGVPPFFAILVVGGLIGWAVFQIIGYHNTRTAQTNGNQVVVWERERDLRALNTGSAALSGSTFLTLGHVDGNRVYSYIYETPDGGFIVDTESLGRAMVYEVDDLTEPYMREVRSRGDWWWTWTAVRERTEFYVPKGSVMDESYDVSIEGKVG